MATKTKRNTRSVSKTRVRARAGRSGRKPAPRKALTKAAAKAKARPKAKAAAAPRARSRAKPAVKKAANTKAKSKKMVKSRSVAAKRGASSKNVRSVKATAKKRPPAKAAVKKPVRAAAPKPAAKVPARKPVPAKAATKPVPAKATAGHAPAKPVAKAVPAKAPAKPTKPFSVKKLGDFACGDYVVYPTHGVGKIEAIEEQDIAGFTLRLYVVCFEKEKMTLRVPVNKAEDSGLRKLSTRQQIDVALSTLKGRSRVSRAMWSRRAQEYEAKINSGDPVSIAEVVRDLHRNAGQPDQSYSERQIYEAALERLARELAAVERIDSDAAAVKLEQFLVKAA